MMNDIEKNKDQDQENSSGEERLEQTNDEKLEAKDSEESKEEAEELSAAEESSASEETSESEDDSEESDDEISFRVETNEESGAPVFSEEISAFDLAASEASSEDEERSIDGNPELTSDGEPVAASPEEGLSLSEELTLAGKVEAIIFASPKPLRTVEIHELLMEQGYTLKEIQDALDEMSEFYRDRGGGFHLKYIKRMGYQFQTTPAAKPLMEKQFSSRPRPLSRAALETLAVIAYRQKINKGVTRAEVEFIRGVDAGSIFKTLVERNLLTCIGRKEIPGRPMMFGVTDEFLKVFQLGSINDLPPLESFQSPPDVIKAAHDKITAFEAEQEGVDPEAFIGDEAYTETLGENDFDILGAQAAPYAPSLERLDEVRADVASAEAEEKELDAIPPEVLASMAQSELAELTEADLAAAAIEEKDNAVPAEIIEHIAEADQHMHHAVDELDKMRHDEIAFSVPEKPEREIEGASLAPDDDDWDSDGSEETINPSEEQTMLTDSEETEIDVEMPSSLEGPLPEKSKDH